MRRPAQENFTLASAGLELTILINEVTMWQHNTVIRRTILLSLFLVSIAAPLLAQDIRPQPKWWFGGAAGANIIRYNGTTQMLNENLTSPNPFHQGSGVAPYVGFGLEYRPNPGLGGMLYVGFDDRNGKWKDNVEPCGEPGHLSTTLGYLSIEPSLRISPFKSSFYFYFGPRIGINRSKEFSFDVPGKIDTTADFSDVRSTVISGEVGVGYDFHLSKETDPTQVDLSPFVSFHPYMGNDPRTVENWAVTNVRAGIILKVGKGRVGKRVVERTPEAVIEGDVEFAVRAPKIIPVKRRVRESFPIRNYVFFDEGSSELPGRYVKLTKSQAGNFKEEQLQEVQPLNLNGRSLRQMTVYYNILNILGDRMKRNPGTTISLSGSSSKGAVHGKARAETIKAYLVGVFEIDASRITTEGRVKPRMASEQKGATMDLALLREGDSRVDIETTSPEMLLESKRNLVDVLTLQVGGAPHTLLKPVQIVAVLEDPLEGHVILDVAGASEVLSSWTVELTDEKGRLQRFGPYYQERETISGNIILGDRPTGDYKVVLIGKTKNGQTIRKERTVHLIKREEPKNEAVRYSILFDFDKSKTVETYEKFLVDVVAPLIPANSTVVIHGHTDIIGEAEYNTILAYKRAESTQAILKRALTKAGTANVVFETLDFGEDVDKAPFDNKYPEERFYNRTVIIDIVPEN